MAYNSSINLSVVNNLDGFTLSGNYPTGRALTVTSGNVILQGGGTIYDGQLLIGNSAGNSYDQGSLVGGTGIYIHSGAGFLIVNATSGSVGTSGYSGLSGYSGISGQSGFSGKSGLSGYSGLSGQDGVIGISGFSGLSGFSGIGISGFSGAAGGAGSLAYNNFYIDAGSMTPPTGFYPTGITYTTSGNLYTLDAYYFDAGLENFANFKFAFPDVWDRGSIKSKFYWTVSSGTSTGVVWGISARGFDHGEFFTGTLGTEALSTGVVLGREQLHISLSAPFLVESVTGSSELVVFKVARKVSNVSDAYAGAARLLGVNLQWRESGVAASAW